jgi:hypothetical protein
MDADAGDHPAPAPYDVQVFRPRSADTVRVDRRQEAGVRPTLELGPVLHVLLDELLLPGDAVRLTPVELDDDRVRTAERGQARHALLRGVLLGALGEGADERPADLVEGERLDEVGRVALLVDVDEGHQADHVRGDPRVVEDRHLVLVVLALTAVDAVALVLDGTRGVPDLLLAVLGVVVHEPITARDVQARLGHVRVVRLALAEHRDDQVEVDIDSLHLQFVPAGTDDAARLLVEIAEVQPVALLDRRTELGEFVGLQRQTRHVHLPNIVPYKGVSGGPYATGIVVYYTDDTQFVNAPIYILCKNIS